MAELKLVRRSDMLLEAADDETLRLISKMDIGREFGAKTENTETGSVPMLKTWRMWMAQTAAFMTWRGCRMPLYIDSNGNARGERDFNDDDAHEMFTAHWMGVDDGGRRYSWVMRTKDPNITPAPKSMRLYAMEKHLAWSIEKGIKLTIPRNSEFNQLRQEQEA